MARSEFSKATKRAAHERSEGRCEAIGVWYGLPPKTRCNVTLAGSGVEYDHIIRAADGGDNSLENCAAVCTKCHTEKTRKFDIPQAAKTKRMSDKDKGIRRATPKMQSAGFAKKPKPDKLPLPERKRGLYGDKR